MGTDPHSPDDRWLRDAMERQIPVIYFLGVLRGHYQAIIPTFIVGWHPERLRVDLVFGVIVELLPKPRSQPLQSAATPCGRSKRGSSGVIPRCRSCGLSGAVRDFPYTRAATAGCRPHRHGCERAVRAAGRVEWSAADKAASRGLRCPFNRYRPRLPNSCLRSAARNSRWPV
jgi:hypothetical protein